MIMGIFNKKKKSEQEALSADSSVQVGSDTDGAADVPAISVNTDSGKRKKRSKDSMASVLSESVIETVLEDFRNNKKGIVDKDGSPVYVGLLIKAEDIGGLSKKSKKDEAKGTIIECVHSRRIKTFILAPMLENEEFVIIPDAETLDAMDEFMLLKDAPYYLTFVEPTGAAETTDYKVTFDEVASVIANGNDMMELLADKNVPWAFEEESPDEPSFESSDGFAEEPFGVDDIVDESDVLFYDTDESDSDSLSSQLADTQTIPVVNDVDEAENASFDDEFYGDDESIDEESVLGGEEVFDSDTVDEDSWEDDKEFVSEDSVNEAIVRRFLSDELGLEVSTDAFDAAFVQGDVFIGFDENRADGWLNGYLNQMSKEANLELRRLHDGNLKAARLEFYRLLSLYVEAIVKSLDINDSETQYGQLFEAISRQRIESMEGLQRLVAEKRKEIGDAWEAALEQAAADAAAVAKKNLRDSQGLRHHERLQRVEPDIKALIENTYHDSIRELNDRRRSDARKYLDYGVTQTLQEVHKGYIGKLEEENEVYAKFREKLNVYLDENRKEDIAHDQVLADELAQAEKADGVRAEFTAKISQLNAEFENKAVQQRVEIEEIQRTTKQAIEQKTLECDNQVKKLNEIIEDQNTRIAELIEQFSSLDDAKERKYDAQLQKQADTIAFLKSETSRGNIIRNAIVVVAVVAALAIGVIVGINLSGGTISNSAEQSITKEFNDRMDKVEDDVEAQSEPKDASSDK
jgi:hypothetical protein